MNLKIYRLDPVEFLSVPGLEWQPALKNNEVKSELLTDVDMLLWLKKELEEELVMLSMTKDNNKYMKDYDKNKES